MFCCNGKNWLTLTNFVYLMNFYNCFAFQKALFLCENVVKCFILKFNSFRFSHLLEYFISLWIMLVQSIQHMLQIAGYPSEFVSFVFCYIKWPFWLGEGEQHRRLELSSHVAGVRLESYCNDIPQQELTEKEILQSIIRITANLFSCDHNTFR